MVPPAQFLLRTDAIARGAVSLVAIDFERRAWVSTVMAGKPMEAYLEARLPDGLY
jgi:hypothetical protein